MLDHHACCFAQTDPECTDLAVHEEDEINDKEIWFFHY